MFPKASLVLFTLGAVNALAMGRSSTVDSATLPSLVPLTGMNLAVAFEPIPGACPSDDPATFIWLPPDRNEPTLCTKAVETDPAFPSSTIVAGYEYSLHGAPDAGPAPKVTAYLIVNNVGFGRTECTLPEVTVHGSHSYPVKAGSCRLPLSQLGPALFPFRYQLSYRVVVELKHGTETFVSTTFMPAPESYSLTCHRGERGYRLAQPDAEPAR